MATFQADTEMHTDLASFLQYSACIGNGTFGLVFAATDPSSKFLSAVKVLFPDSDSEEGASEEKQIRRECSITANLDQHKNVVKVTNITDKQFSLEELNQIFPENLFETTEQNKLRAGLIHRLRMVPAIRGIFIQMELCGENLRKWLRKQITLQDENIHYQQFVIILNMSAGLKHLHDNKIIHRDLKPENVMFSNLGFVFPVKIGDFGLSRNLHLEESQKSSLTSRAGTLDYMAPESFTKEYSFPADLFSLGLVIWEVVQLIQFNKKKRLFDRLVNDKEEGLVKLSRETEEIKKLIISLTKRQVGERMKTMEEVNQFIVAWKFNIIHKYGAITGLVPENFVAKTEDELRAVLLHILPDSKVTFTENTKPTFGFRKFRKEDIGRPVNFRHVQRITLDHNIGFTLRGLDSAIGVLFEKAAVSSDFQDDNTRQFIYDFIERNGGLERIRSKNRPAAPPPPPLSLATSNSETPPVPNRSVQAAKLVAPPRPPSPPVPPVFGYNEYIPDPPPPRS